MSDMRRLIGRDPCCDEDTGGSHYHCGRCNKVSGMMGCSRSIHYVDGKRIKVPFHFCCPDDCELENE